MNTEKKSDGDVMWLRTVSSMAVAIESYGICNALGAFKTALEDMQEERSQDTRITLTVTSAATSSKLSDSEDSNKS